MNGFKYYTRGRTSPQGKPRVCFTAHPDDYSKYFESIRKEILDRQNCAVFYIDSKTHPSEVDDYEICLGEMQLFVVPITKKLLSSGNRAMDFDIPFAFEHHIPVLPLMQESDLNQLYKSKFGDLQFLDKSIYDPTAIPYEVKLDRFLESIIVGDEIARQVRDSFDGYIFLSYRKKDRRYAKELMRLIHDLPFCRDVAIWYDEFLTPGEDFKVAINDRLQKSNLFALVVTSNIIEMPGGNPNYVMQEEYPAAYNAGKYILPVELVHTNRRSLKKHFQGCPKPIKIGERKKLENQLSICFKDLASRSNNNDALHIYYIGLAYLSGIDVEVNHKLAVELLTASAEAKNIEAIMKLVAMYNTGEGVERDYYKAVEWQEELVAVLESFYDYPLDDEAEEIKQVVPIALWDALWYLGNYYSDLQLMDKAKEAYEKMLTLTEKYSESFQMDPDFVRCRSASYGKLADIALAEGKNAEAKRYLMISMETFKSLAEMTGTVLARRDLALAYNRLGLIASGFGEIKKAEEYHLQEYAIDKMLLAETGTEEARLAVANSCIHLGNVFKDEGYTQQANEYYMKALQNLEELSEYANSSKVRNSLCIVFRAMGILEKNRKNYQQAEVYCFKALSIAETQVEETKSIKARQELSHVLLTIGNLYFADNKPKKAKSYYQHAFEVSKELAEESDSVEARSIQAKFLMGLGGVADNEKNYREGRTFYEQALVLLKPLAERNKSIDILHSLSVCYYSLGNIAIAENDLTLADNLSEAKDYYMLSFSLIKELAKKTEDAGIHNHLACSYYQMGIVHHNKQYIKHAIRIWKSLSERFSDDTSYLSNINLAKKAIRSLFR